MTRLIQGRHMQGTPDARIEHVDDTPNAHTRHVCDTHNTHREHNDDTLSSKEMEDLKRSTL